MNKLFFCILFLAFHGALAHEQKVDELELPYNIDSESFLAAEHEASKQHDYGCSGNVRTGYIQSSLGSSNTLSANAIGGELGCSYSFNQYVNVHLGLFTSIDTGLNHSDDSKRQEDFFNAKQDGYVILGEAVLTLNYDKFEAHLGRQRFDSPHMDGDDLRMIPNLFEAYLVDYHFSNDISFGTGFVRQMSGWENGADRSRFIGVGDAFGGEGDASWVSWLTYKQKHLNSHFWYYLIPDHMHMFYAEVNYNNRINRIFSYSLGLQFDWGTDTGSSKLGPVQANTWGVLAALSAYNITASFAYNHNFSNQAALPSLGGGPFFTSMEDLTLDAVSGKNASALLLSLEYSPFKFITLGSAYGKFHAEDKSQFHIDEIDIFVAINWKAITLEVMYANLDDKNTPDDDHQFRTIFTYHF